MIESNTPTTCLDLLSKLSKIISRLHYLSQEDIAFILAEGLDFLRREDIGEDGIADAFHRAVDLDKLVTDIIATDFRFRNDPTYVGIKMALIVYHICYSNWDFRLMSQLNRVPVIIGGTPTRPRLMILEGECYTK